MQVFADTAAWIALVNERDDLHSQAIEVRKDLQRQKTRLVTTEFVLLEFMDALSAPLSRLKALAFLRGLQKMTTVEIVPATSALMEEALQLYGQRADKEWGVTDCTSFVVMTQKNISEAFTSDHHFEQAGFRKLL